MWISCLAVKLLGKEGVQQSVCRRSNHMEMIRHEAETVNAKAFVLLTEMEVVDDSFRYSDRMKMSVQPTTVSVTK
jgi:hypothetical protein